MTIRMLASVAGYALGSIVSLSPVAEAAYVAAAQAQYYTFPAAPNTGGNPPASRILAMVRSRASSPTAARWPPTAR